MRSELRLIKRDDRCGTGHVSGVQCVCWLMEEKVRTRRSLLGEKEKAKQILLMY
jgi:hypothetical protein